MKLKAILLSTTAMLLLSVTTQAQARTLNHLDLNERTIAEEEYSVDEVEQINMRGKPVFTEYWLTNSDQYGPYPAKKRVRISRTLTGARDQRRYPAFLPAVPLYSNGLTSRSAIAPTSLRNTTVRYNYYNAPITKNNKLEGVTFYNNYSAYDGYVRRW